MARVASPGSHSLPDKLSSNDDQNKPAISDLLMDLSGDLNEQVREATKKFTSQNVAQFGLSLGVPFHEIKNLRRLSSLHSPQVQAMEIYEFWMKSKGGLLSPEDQRKCIIKALEDAHHGREAVKLREGTGRRKNRTKTQHDLTEGEVYKRLLSTAELNKSKIKNFGLALGLQSAVIDSIISENSSDGDVVTAHAVFVEWKFNCKEKDDRMSVMLNQAFDSAFSNHVPTPMMHCDIESLPISPVIPPSPDVLPIYPVDQPIGQGQGQPVIQFHTTRTREDTTHSRQARQIPQPPNVDNEPQNIDDENTPLNPRPDEKEDKNVPCMKCCCSLTVIIIVLLIILEVIFIVLGFTYNNQHTTIILTGDTISISLPSYTPSSIKIQLWGPQDTCSAKFIATHCDLIDTETEHMTFMNINYNYLAPGSEISISSQDNPTLRRPYQLWLFSDLIDAENAENDKFYGYNCKTPPDRSQCKQLDDDPNSLVYFNIKEPSYYYMRCERSPFNCTQVNYWRVVQVSYNISELSNQDIIDSLLLHTQNISQTLYIRRNYGGPLSSKNVCVFAKLDPESCGLDNKYFIILNYSSMFREICLYAIPLLVFIGSLCLGIIGCYYCIMNLRYKNKRNKRRREN